MEQPHSRRRGLLSGMAIVLNLILIAMIIAMGLVIVPTIEQEIQQNAPDKELPLITTAIFALNPAGYIVIGVLLAILVPIKEVMRRGSTSRMLGLVFYMIIIASMVLITLGLLFGILSTGLLGTS